MKMLRLPKTPTIERNGRKWKVWVIDETDVTVTVEVRPSIETDPIHFSL